MIPPLQITFHQVQPSPAAAARIRAAVEKLPRYYPRITSCRVVVEAAQRHQRHGSPYTVHIALQLPGTRIAIGRQPGRRPEATRGTALGTAKRLQPNTRHKDLYVAIHDAFDVARRRLEEYARKHRGDVKTPAGRRREAA